MPMFLLTTAAFAALADPATAPAIPAAPAAPAAATQADQSAKVYCISYTPTGTRLPRRDCHTRADWMKKGFDPLAPND